MSTVRRLALFAVLLLAAQPLSACIICMWDGSCNNQPPPQLYQCMPLVDGCTDHWYECVNFAPEPLATQWTVASVEITRPAEPPRRSTDEVEIASADPHTHSHPQQDR